MEVIINRKCQIIMHGYSVSSNCGGGGVSSSCWGGGVSSGCGGGACLPVVGVGLLQGVSIYLYVAEAEGVSQSLFFS